MRFRDLRRMSDGQLADRARNGDRRAESELSDRLCPRVARLAGAIAGDAHVGTKVAREAFTRALQRTGTPVAAEVVAEAQRLAMTRRTSASELGDLPARERAAVLAVDVEGLTPERAARELGVESDEVATWLERGRQALGAPPPPSCAGWQLVSRYENLSDAEQAAADAHLEICGDCREAHDARAAIRRRLTRSVPLQVASAGGGAGLGALLATAAGSGLAAAAAATLVAGVLALPNVTANSARTVAQVTRDATAADTSGGSAGATGAGVAEDPGAPVPPQRPDPRDGARQAGDTPRGNGGGAGGADSFGDAVDDVGDAVDDVVDGIGDPVRDVCGDLLGDCPVPDPSGPLSDAADAVGDGGGALPQEAPPTSTGGIQDLVDDVSDDVESSGETINDFLDEVAGGASEAVDEVTDTVDDTADAVTGTVDDTAGEVTGAVDDATDATSGTVDGVTDTVDDTTSDAGDTVDDTTDAVDEATGGASTPVTDAVDDTTDSTTDAVGDATETADNTADGVTDTVDDTTSDAGDTVDDTTDAVDETTDAVDDTVDDVVDGL